MSSTRTVTVWVVPAVHVVDGSGEKTSLAAVAWVTVTATDVPVVSPEDVAWILRVPGVVIWHVKAATPAMALLVSVAPVEGQPSEVAARVMLAVLVVTTFP